MRTEVPTYFIKELHWFHWVDIGGRSMKKRIPDDEEVEVTLTIGKLREIAEYYEFPLAVFFTEEGHLKGKGPRSKNILKKAEAFNRIKDIVEEVEENTEEE